LSKTVLKQFLTKVGFFLQKLDVRKNCTVLVFMVFVKTGPVWNGFVILLAVGEL
jgi:hypothetical protein